MWTAIDNNTLTIIQHSQNKLKKKQLHNYTVDNIPAVSPHIKSQWHSLDYFQNKIPSLFLYTLCQDNE